MIFASPITAPPRSPRRRDRAAGEGGAVPGEKGMPRPQAAIPGQRTVLTAVPTTVKDELYRRELQSSATWRRTASPGSDGPQTPAHQAFSISPGHVTSRANVEEAMSISFRELIRGALRRASSAAWGSSGRDFGRPPLRAAFPLLTQHHPLVRCISTASRSWAPPFVRGGDRDGQNRPTSFVRSPFSYSYTKTQPYSSLPRRHGLYVALSGAHGGRPRRT